VLGSVVCRFGCKGGGHDDDAIRVADKPVTWTDRDATQCDNPIHFDRHDGALDGGCVDVSSVHRQVDVAHLPDITNCAVYHETGGATSLQACRHNVAVDATFVVATGVGDKDLTQADLFDRFSVGVGLAVWPELRKIGTAGDEANRAGTAGHAQSWVDNVESWNEGVSIPALIKPVGHGGNGTVAEAAGNLGVINVLVSHLFALSLFERLRIVTAR
jgi:hypothetical protein